MKEVSVDFESKKMKRFEEFLHELKGKFDGIATAEVSRVWD